MKMGIKEFRERLGEVARGTESVELTDRGKVIGTYTPWPKVDDDHRLRAIEAMEKHGRWLDDLRAQGVDTDGALAEIGLDPWGVSLGQTRDR